MGTFEGLRPGEWAQPAPVTRKVDVTESGVSNHRHNSEVGMCIVVKTTLTI